jgi:hypothetical protein
MRSELKDAPQLTRLVTDLAGLSPDRGFNILPPYFKGVVFLRLIEQTVGGEGEVQKKPGLA